ncbi:HlyD family efflux transporter periplasmic adaptor subunit [Undibacterium sp. CY18W]|uniref:HlyD family efflux transporter periplasmic adaptor subunit n=1 Tax=Undibacterium hunanense TaxID=2762292 RepID=A0ABR6ZNT5_9BURK|nr:HlyD family efflux transporter periplasmic adaptor subunit [Undibacterium hunanense]MBC3917523.1 HlyD family efflux transporter periplasmic adaptor subunit [Undibacterium hunanense]
MRTFAAWCLPATLLIVGPLLAITSLAQTSTSSPSATSAASAGTVKTRPVLLTGEVIAKDSQAIFVPPSNSSPVVLRNFVAEGSKVKKGDLLLRIETPNSSNIEQLIIGIDQTRAKTEAEVAKLEVAALEAEKNLVTAKAALAKALVDAALPKSQITALDFDKYQAEKERAERDLKVKQLAFDDGTAAVNRRKSDGDLELQKQQVNVAYLKAQLARSEVLASQDGIVVHGYSAWRGERLEEGSSAFPGNVAGQVMGSGQMEVKAWALEADRIYLAEGQPVQLTFDALPGVTIQTTITTISHAPEEHTRWGYGRYFRVDIKLPAQLGNYALSPGMSVLIEPLQTAKKSASALPLATKAAKAAKAAKNETASEITIEGDIQSRVVTPIGPPSIPYIWQYTLAQMAPEGSIVKAGDVLVMFQASEVPTQLANQKSQLNEKQRAMEKLKLEHAEAEKAADLAVAEAQSNAEKAARKATMPKELIRRIDYDKLVIEKSLNADLAALSVKLRATQIRARKAEKIGLETEIAQLQGKIDVLAKGQKNLTVIAKKPGMMIYKTNFSDDKFAVGSQVWVGISVASIADPDKLFVSAKVPEAQSNAIRVGQTARINIPGANLTLAARVTGLSTVFHSKSTTQPIIVRDVELEFEQPPKGLKPGAAVQAILSTANSAASSTASPTTATPGGASPAVKAGAEKKS